MKITTEVVIRVKMTHDGDTFLTMLGGILSVKNRINSPCPNEQKRNLEILSTDVESFIIGKVV